jgi:hypothetical protein
MPRITRIDVGDNLDGSGQSWDTIQAYDVSPDGNSVAVSIGFDIDFGAGVFNTLFINENGFVSFGTTAVAYDPLATDLTTLGGNVLAPYYADLTSADVSGPLSAFEDGNNTPSVSSSTGLIDLAADGDFSTPAGPTTPAFRVTWFDVGIPGYTTGNGPDSNQGTIQLVLFDTDGAAGNNFDIEFNYQLTTPPNPATAGYVLGSNVLTYGGPFTPDFTAGPSFYHFCGGVQSTTACGTTPPPTTVSEPGTLALMGAGLAVLALILARRRGRRQGER